MGVQVRTFLVSKFLHGSWKQAKINHNRKLGDSLILAKDLEVPATMADRFFKV